MLIYFHIDELARDSVVASSLKRELESVGGKVVYGNRLMTDYVLRHLNVFDAVILPSLIHFLYAFPDAKRLPDNVFVLQTEAIGQATGTLRRLNAKYFGHDTARDKPWHEAVVGYLLWGHAHLNPFHQFYPNYLEKCRVVGHPRLSKRCKNNIATAKAKPVVGFVSRFTLLSPFDGRTPFESVCSSMRAGPGTSALYENSPDRDVEDMFYIEVIDFRVMLKVMTSLDSSRYAITVRPHPRENRMGWERLAKKLNLNISVSPWDEPFGHWLQKIDYIVSPPSTGLYDIFFHGKRAIVINDVVPTRAKHTLTESDDNNQILEGVCRPKSVEEIVSLIESGDIPYNKEIVGRRLQEQVAADIAGNSTANIVNAIAELSVARHRNRPGVKLKFKRALFTALSLALSYLRWFRGKLRGRVEQGANFDLTVHRIRWISALTSNQADR